MKQTRASKVETLGKDERKDISKRLAFLYCERNISEENEPEEYADLFSDAYIKIFETLKPKSEED